MELSKFLSDYSKTIHGKQQLIIQAFAQALEIIPHQISSNAGLDATMILNKLRQLHRQRLYLIIDHLLCIYPILYSHILY
jgi:chaperonin GroEL (HSP60 family)